MKRPSNRNFNSFSNWILNQTPSPLAREDMEFLRHGEDFVALADGEEGGWFDGVVEDVLSCLPGGLENVNLHSACSTRAIKLIPARTC